MERERERERETGIKGGGGRITHWNQININSIIVCLGYILIFENTYIEKQSVEFHVGGKIEWVLQI